MALPNAVFLKYRYDYYEICYYNLTNNFMKDHFSLYVSTFFKPFQAHLFLWLW